MRTARVMALAIAVVFVALAGIALPAHAALKIAPTEAEPGHPFTIIDTPTQRIVDGSVAVFRFFGIETVLPLRTHKPYNTAQSRLASRMYGGVYTVSLRQPDGTEFEIGPFTVLGPSAPPPFIEPDLGPPGTAFTITDYLARIESGDLAIFYAEGTDPATQGVAVSVNVSPDGTTMTGAVPGGAAQGVQNFVSVRPLGGPSRFGDLAFFVTGLPQPTIAPTSGTNGDAFVIRDPEGRMAGATIVVFFPQGASPDFGTQVQGPEFSADGTEARGSVPSGIGAGTYFVTVHMTSVSEPPIFNALAFSVN